MSYEVCEHFRPVESHQTTRGVCQTANMCAKEANQGPYLAITSKTRAKIEMRAFSLSEARDSA